MIVCCQCAALFPGTRSDARRAMWEPYSSRSQSALDEGPMVCATCIDTTLAKMLDVMKHADSSRHDTRAE